MFKLRHKSKGVLPLTGRTTVQGSHLASDPSFWLVWLKNSAAGVRQEVHWMAWLENSHRAPCTSSSAKTAPPADDGIL
jgi:hypothetical protein